MRTDPSVFNLPVDKIKTGYYSDQYFNYTKAIFEGKGAYKPPVVTMQVFQKKNAVIAGIDEAIAILKLCSGQYVRHLGEDLVAHHLDLFGTLPAGSEEFIWQEGWDQLKVYALEEGDLAVPHEPVMHIVGPYNLFAHLETVYLGTLARRTMIATNVREVIQAANGKPIWYFPARHDHWAVQTGDGFAAHAAGVAGVSTDAQANWWGGKGMGTVPHALIAAFNGDTVGAAIAFSHKYGGEMNISVLVDFENNCARTAVEVADELKQRNLPLYGVRLDTSESLVDYGLINQMGQFKPTGVNPQLVRHVRAELDANGHEDIKIICSGGFDAEKIRRFERDAVPVDAYGVGASLIHGDFAYTADVVQVHNRAVVPCGKVGRKFIANPRLKKVE